MQKTITSLLIAMMLALPTIGITAPEQAGTSEQPDLSTPKGQMDVLAEKAITETVKVVAEAGGFFPFGMVMDSESTVRIVGIGEKPSEGTTKNETAVTLFWQLRRLLQDNPAFVAAAIIKPHNVTDEDGKSVPGIWVTVDHRDHDAWVIFLPFLEQPDGTYKVGEQPAYLPAKEPLFLPGLKQGSAKQ